MPGHGMGRVRLPGTRWASIEVTLFLPPPFYMATKYLSASLLSAFTPAAHPQGSARLQGDGGLVSVEEKRFSSFFCLMARLHSATLFVLSQYLFPILLQSCVSQS